MEEKTPAKVLIVEDEPDALELYLDIISGAGYEAEGAPNGEEALTKLSQHPYQLVILDIIMPKKDGVATLAEIKAHPDKYGTPKVIMLSNIGGDIAVDKAMELGAEGYMLKSEVEPAELVSILQKYIA